MNNFNTNTDNEQTWLTPKYIIDSLGSFTLDPCCPPDMPWVTATNMNSTEDGLSLDWKCERVWLNPPYGKETFKWLVKLSNSGSGIALIFARTETIGFHDIIWDKAHSVFFFKGRIKFHKADGSLANAANVPSCLVSYSAEDTLSISNSGLIGRLVIL